MFQPCVTGETLVKQVVISGRCILVLRRQLSRPGSPLWLSLAFGLDESSKRTCAFSPVSGPDIDGLTLSKICPAKGRTSFDVHELWVSQNMIHDSFFKRAKRRLASSIFSIPGSASFQMSRNSSYCLMALFVQPDFS